jgi:TonB family protein
MHRTFSTALAALAALIILVSSIAPSVTQASADDKASYEQALTLLRSSKDNEQAVKMFERAAIQGDIRASFMLGAIYWEGKLVPRNRPLAFAYLQLAAQDNGLYYKAMSDKAKEWVRTSQASLSGSELIEADRLSAQLAAEVHSYLAAALAPALRLFTTESAVSYDPVILFAREPIELLPPPAEDGTTGYRPGCGVAVHAGCPRGSKDSSEKRCTGQLSKADTAPTAAPGSGAILVEPDYPVGVARAGEGGSVMLLLHVDSSGLICAAAIAVPSGTASLDDSALDAVGKWKLKPAMKNGVPVESLLPMTLTFQVTD